MYDALVVKDVFEEDWGFDGGMTATERIGSGLQEKFSDLFFECRVVHTELPAGLVNAVGIAKCRVTFEVQLSKSERELQKPEHEL